MSTIPIVPCVFLECLPSHVGHVVGLVRQLAYFCPLFRCSVADAGAGLVLLRASEAFYDVCDGHSADRVMVLYVTKVCCSVLES